VKVPSAEFQLADVRSLPVASESRDLVVCGLALTHLPELDGVMAEFARVLRPGGSCAEAARVAYTSTPALIALEVVKT
jgi:ubiquinone/menaquinone biosynthesis C-methylase UbiE